MIQWRAVLITMHAFLLMPVRLTCARLHTSYCLRRALHAAIQMVAVFVCFFSMAFPARVPDQDFRHAGVALFVLRRWRTAVHG